MEFPEDPEEKLEFGFSPEMVFQIIFGFELRPVSERDVQTMIATKNRFLIPLGVKRCRVRTEPTATFMLVKNGERWHFVMGNDKRFQDGPLKNRSLCTQAWGYFGGVPPFHTVRDRTMVYSIKGGFVDSAEEDQDIPYEACMIITDPPSLPLLVKFEVRDTQLGGVTHDLGLPWALQYAPEFGGCPVEKLLFVYNNAAFDQGRIFPDRPSPEWLALATVDPTAVLGPRWQSMSVADQYYFIEVALRESAPPNPQQHSTEVYGSVTLPKRLDGMTSDEVKELAAGRTLNALSSIDDFNGYVIVSVFDSAMQFTSTPAEVHQIDRCRRATREEQQTTHDYFEPLELQEIERDRVRDRSRADQLPVGVNPNECMNELDYFSQYKWDEFFKEKENADKTVVTIFFQPGKRGYCYALDDLLADLERVRAYKWLGTQDFGRPDPTKKYHQVLGLAIWIDTNSLDRLVLSGSRLFVAQPLGKELLGQYSGPFKEGPQDVYTLVPLSLQNYTDYVKAPNRDKVAKRAAGELEPSTARPVKSRRVAPVWLGPSSGIPEASRRV